MRVPIAQRPKRVDSRHEFGHFESDTVIGTAPSKRCIDTQVERKSRRLFARFIEDKSALATARAEYDIYKDIPAPARIDRTWDNGTESSCHLLVDEALGMLTYYANPYSSYQRGTNENRNGRIRRYLPKKTSFDDLTDADLQAIVDEINDTPMKVLDWETPNEARIQLVSATAGFGSACFDCSLAISSSHTSLGVLYPRSFMGVSLISPTIASSSSCVRSSKLVPLGR